MSSGYDSPATAVLAKWCGATSAVTFVSGRANFGPQSDSGSTIARHLDLAVETFDRLMYRDRADFPEAEFLATGAGGEDVVMCAFEEAFRNSCVLTGFLGDTLWERKHPSPWLSKDMQFKYPGGGSLSEFRLRVGFVHLPVPLMTLRSHESIYAISNSDEMKQWSTGQEGYDRPIARRIVETAGVRRELFGQKKNAVTQPFYRAIGDGGMLSPTSRRDLRLFWETGGEGLVSFRSIWLRVINRWLVETGVADRVRDRIRRTRWAPRFEPAFAALRRATADGAIFQWGVARSISRLGAFTADTAGDEGRSGLS